MFIFLLLFLLPSTAIAFSSQYDKEIERSVEQYWTTFPRWRIYKAQLWQESRFNPTARSPVGAEGLAQFMPDTWKQVSRQMGIPHGIRASDARYSIQAGAFYMERMRRKWIAKRKPLGRQRLALASYNAGFGNILKAQRECGDARLWGEIKLCLYQITGKHAKETKDYVSKILRYWIEMEMR